MAVTPVREVEHTANLAPHRPLETTPPRDPDLEVATEEAIQVIRDSPDPQPLQIMQPMLVVLTRRLGQHPVLQLPGQTATTTLEAAETVVVVLAVLTEVDPRHPLLMEPHLRRLPPQPQPLHQHLPTTK